MLFRIINALYRRFVFEALKAREIKNEQSIEENQVMAGIDDSFLSPLTEREIQEVKRLWAPLMGDGLTSFKEFALFKHFHGFDPKFVSHYIYLPILSHRLNNYKYTMMFEHKSLLGILSRGALKFPNCIVRCIDHEFFDNDMRQISENEAIRLCSVQNEIILKDSVASSGGRSFEKIKLDGAPESRAELVKKSINNRRHHDFVIQERLRQHPSMSIFNPTSINTIRVTSLYLNGRFSVQTIVLRIGKQGMQIDNWGGGGIIIGIDKDGHLNKIGFDNKFKAYESYNGVTFGTVILSQIPSLLQLLEEAHTTQFSLCKLIGWDISFDENNNPVIIELNSSQPGLIGEQLTHGPVFGDRTEEVIRYCADKQTFYSRSLFNY